MKHDDLPPQSDETKAVESTTYELDPKFLAVVRYLVAAPGEQMEDHEAVTFSTALEIIMESDLGDVVKDAYRDSKEGAWDDLDFKVFVTDHAFEIAREHGWDVVRVIRDGRKL